MSKRPIIIPDAFVISGRDMAGDYTMYSVAHGLQHGQTSSHVRKENILDSQEVVPHYLRMGGSYLTEVNIFHLQIGKKIDADTLRQLHREHLIRVHNLSQEDIQILQDK